MHYSYLLFVLLYARVIPAVAVSVYSFGGAKELEEIYSDWPL